MKYTREQIERHFKWAANNKTPITDKWIDWCAKSIFIIQEILKENERYRAALSGIVKRSEDTGHYDINSAEASKALKGEE